MIIEIKYFKIDKNKEKLYFILLALPLIIELDYSIINGVAVKLN